MSGPVPCAVSEAKESKAVWEQLGRVEFRSGESAGCKLSSGASCWPPFSSELVLGLSESKATFEYIMCICGGAAVY